MSGAHALSHVFVDCIPDVLEDGTVYVSIEYATVAHKCCCGCGQEVVTPLSPTDWRLVFDGDTISLDPSIGNWSFPCRSHYWIRRNKVLWAAAWTDEQIRMGRQKDVQAKDRFFAAGAQGAASGAPPAAPLPEPHAQRPGLLPRIWRWLKER